MLDYLGFVTIFLWFLVIMVSIELVLSIVLLVTTLMDINQSKKRGNDKHDETDRSEK